MNAITLPQLAAGLFAGLALLGFGAAIGNNRDAREGGMEPVSLLIKAAGLGLLTYTLYRFVKG
ncbi:MAG: hypothetical protein JNK72_12575 [Myxococcales bacterium]|nr:hypothetical protein [Myxococcales bacterium]